ncbi:hypothetical protein [Leucothrix pacifica]|uniref:Uncharacterized protein n=1 Tax=Leucothrix pacifica TaxID=1247513 RepID=A0A317C8U9_9GAMM|nr:hypothetical protein [Leucothrix pacifica]PWQ95095.1 hypothetical protein DKW60_15575 [Leucothrix pacifica]
MSSSPRGAAGYAKNAAISAVVGGTVSKLVGGKFVNGAITGTFSRMFNDLQHHDLRDPESVGDPNLNAIGRLSGGVGLEGNVTMMNGPGTIGRSLQVIEGDVSQWKYVPVNEYGPGHIEPGRGYGSQAGIAAGGGVEVNLAIGSGSWDGLFKSFTIGAGYYSVSVFKDGSSNWHGVSFSFGLGIPSFSYNETYYAPSTTDFGDI